MKIDDLQDLAREASLELLKMEIHYTSFCDLLNTLRLSASPLLQSLNDSDRNQVIFLNNVVSKKTFIKSKDYFSEEEVNIINEFIIRRQQRAKFKN